MTTTFIATLKVKPGREAEFERLQRELSEDSHATEPGLCVYDVIKHRERERTYVVYARFKDEAAFQAHMATPAHERLVPPILDCLETEMDLQFYDWKS
ncbi:MAG: antibiotic biosynthesis monooxygenase [Steroidobacteraceae bacterium]|nr:antibiotic biosynthesis monooxygenase [Steroidobacteraceae bacterium]MDW8260632.1 antibiotic biosynthesis monooxygenase family protein [Gammaproteobacteria bacterium]